MCVYINYICNYCYNYIIYIYVNHIRCLWNFFLQVKKTIAPGTQVEGAFTRPP